MRTWPAIDIARLDAPDLLQAALYDYDVAAIDERSSDAWRVFFGTHADRDRAAAALPRDFPQLWLQSIDVPDEDWAARSQASLQAIRVGRIIVAPPWDVPDSTPSRGLDQPLTIVIQPSLGFGTGHHATTRLCLASLQRFNLRGCTVIDVGTGSGVLAIAASLLGAARVIAIDDDADAAECARENAVRNDVGIDVQVADLRGLALSRFDLVLANLTGALLIQAARRLQELTSPRGPLVLSGFQKSEEPAVLAAFPDFRMTDRGQEDEWVCATLQREAAFV